MDENNKRPVKLTAAGVISGFLNGLFGSGGGVVAVMFLRNLIGDERKAHASATLMILVMSIISFAFYAVYGHIEYKNGLMFVPGGLCGAVLGTFVLKKIKTDKLHRLFGLILAVSGTVMLFS
ncbi:MAG: sulfite exporter TauE/SafE family protein [Oscillospiraceae bacterium]|nr:sulfite exporter TauE/SafE family protein [Oscillospiraceae bacterium]